MNVRRVLAGGRLASSLLLAALLVASQAAAGDERSTWWTSAAGRAELGLSDAQSRDLEAVFQSLLPRLRAEKEALDRENAALSALMVEGGEEAAIGKAIERVEAARAAANKTRTWMLVKMYRVLSPDQRVKLQSMHERHERERRRRGGPPQP